MDIAVHGAAAVITLTRVKAHNALTDSMRAAIAGSLPRFSRDPQVYAMLIRSTSPKAFSAGGDIRELAALAARDPAEARTSLNREYALKWMMECFSKPTVSLIDGIVMGGGVGLSLYGTHRVAGPGYVFAMPETAIGFFPDDGVAHAFARMPDEIGLYLGLTGRRIGRADAFALGLVTHCIGRERFGEIEAGIAAADPVDPLLDSRHEHPGPAPLLAHRDRIARWFGADDVSEIVARVRSAAGSGGAEGAFAAETLDALARAAPLSLAVTFRHIRMARDLDLRQVLMRDGRLASVLVQGADFREGVRALLVDKDNAPRWCPARNEDVTPAMVERCFAHQGPGDLVLATRQEMQASRI